MSDVIAPLEMYRLLLENTGALEALGSLPLPDINQDALREAHELHDQVFAAMLPRGFAPLPGNGDNRVKRLAFLFCVINAASRRKTWWCEHAFTLDHVMTFVLGSGVGFCGICRDEGARQVKRHQHDDGTCDLCDKPTIAFWPFLWQDGLVYAMGDLCDSCVGFYKRLGESFG